MEELFEQIKREKITSKKDIIRIYEKYKDTLPSTDEELYELIKTNKDKIISAIITSNNSTFYYILLSCVLMSKDNLLSKTTSDSIKALSFLLLLSSASPVTITFLVSYIPFFLFRCVRVTVGLIASLIANPIVRKIVHERHYDDLHYDPYHNYSRDIENEIDDILERIMGVGENSFNLSKYSEFGAEIISNMCDLGFSLAKKGTLGNSDDNKIFLLLKDMINEIILNDNCADYFLFYISTIRNYEYILSPKAKEKVKEYIERLNSGKSKFKSTKDQKQNGGYYKLLFSTFDFSEHETESYPITSSMLGKVGCISTETPIFPCIEPINKEFIDSLKRKNIDRVEYGEYPYGILSVIQMEVLNKAFKLNLLKKTNKMYRVISNNNTFVSYPEYEFYGKKFVKVKNTWVEVLPIRWKVDYTLKCFVFDELSLPRSLVENAILEKRVYNFLRKNFIKEIEVKSKNEVSEELKSEIKKINEDKRREEETIRAKEEIRQKTLKENKNEEEIKKLKEELLGKIVEIEKTLEKLNGLMLNNNQLLTYSNITPTRIKGITEEILFERVDDHYEFNKDFIPHLKYINLSLLRTKNLKVSGIDFRGTNIRINPQEVYNKDLSNSKFDDDNIIGSFKGVNLCGSDISQESFPLDLDEAIIDDNTILPNHVIDKKTL